jgi:hypothetical protein
MKPNIMPETENTHSKRSIVLTISSVFIASVLYATLRYNLFKGVPWIDWPLYTLNKSFAVTSLVLFAIAMRRYFSPNLLSNYEILASAKFFLLMHIFVSLCLFHPEYYPNFFVTEKLSLLASISMLTGSIATALFFHKQSSRIGLDTQAQKAKLLAVISVLVGIHVLLQGFSGWFTPGKWPGFLPPITLISFIAALISVSMFIALKREKSK